MRKQSLLAALALAWLVFGLLDSEALAEPICTSGELFAGAPDFSDPMERASEGQGLRDVPPLGWRSLLFVGDKLLTTVGQEIWFTDLKTPKPMLKRLAGKEDRQGRSAKPGACLDARFANINGIALMSDGSLAGADQTANNIFVVKDPFGPACSVSMIAGAIAPQTRVNPGNPPGLGDVDGPGAIARFTLPNWVAVSGSAIYFIDEGNSKLKKVSSDAAHTVKTVARLPEGTYYELIALKDKLYTIANNTSSEGFILEVDANSGAVRELVRGHADVWRSSGSINVSGLATDGTGLFTTQSGRLLYVTLDGRVKAIAGNGTYFELESGYDPTKPHKASELQLWATRRNQTAGASVFLAYKDGSVYYSASGKTPYVERITCK
jgi:hypothetical protein